MRTQKLKKKTLKFYRTLHSASFDTNMSPVAKKLYALVSLEVEKKREFCDFWEYVPLKNIKN